MKVKLYEYDQKILLQVLKVKVFTAEKFPRWDFNVLAVPALTHQRCLN